MCFSKSSKTLVARKKKSMLAVKRKADERKNRSVLALQNSNQILFGFVSRWPVSGISVNTNVSPEMLLTYMLSKSHQILFKSFTCFKSFTKGVKKKSIQKSKSAWKPLWWTSWFFEVVWQLVSCSWLGWEGEKKPRCRAFADFCSYYWHFCAEKRVGAGVKPAVICVCTVKHELRSDLSLLQSNGSLSRRLGPRAEIGFGKIRFSMRLWLLQLCTVNTEEQTVVCKGHVSQCLTQINGHTGSVVGYNTQAHASITD